MQQREEFDRQTEERDAQDLAIGDWEYTVDNDFAKDLLGIVADNGSSENVVSGESCTVCNNILHPDRLVSQSDLCPTANDCQLCKLLTDALKQHGEGAQDKIYFGRVGLALKIKDGPRILRLCSEPGLFLPFITPAMSVHSLNISENRSFG